MFPINLSLKWLIPFLVFTLGLIAVCAIWILREWGQPEWKQRQGAEYAEMRADLQKQLAILEDPTWGDPKKAKMAKNTIKYLEKPSLQVKQILLKGTGLWKEGRSGVRVDRCMTCHINEDKLIKTHPYTAEHFPFDIYGCTVCHHGNGRALRSEKAHEGMFRNKRDMEKRLARPEDILNLWKEFAALSIQEDLKPSDFKYFNVSGERQIYVGSANCVKCHKKLTAFHVNEWTGNKFITFEKMKQAKDYIEGDENYRKQCLKCHTTGYNEKSGEYAEENVTCEACHGPGEIYSQFMSTGKIAEAATLSERSFDFKVCGDCHLPRRHEMRQAMLLALRDKEPAKEVEVELDTRFKGEDSQGVDMASKDLVSAPSVPQADHPASSEGRDRSLDLSLQSPGQERLDSLAFKSEQLAEIEKPEGISQLPVPVPPKAEGRASPLKAKLKAFKTLGTKEAQLKERGDSRG
ncbi:MAG TPA: multiheme c-type cytochrome [Candidatus Hypogeohydataceae bacterium YC38]